ncbi:class I SAM-dependent methyltransferase [Streptomyces sp. NBC_00879]|uniref:O-methyltransferase n=1 Tax=unclassified Streptomyces TaxID=2593676 RepID=UPI00386E2536|nr:class I SAM-dependent methyltransferase [Streptomyces sp. NBC_00885]WSY79151.1 class I SAM-dependent methyltransferase [Streptomyces sp. NBC_00879]
MTLTHTLADPRVEVALSRMFAQAAHDEATAARVQAQRPGGFGTPQEQADAAAEIYMPISAAGGQLLYNLVRAVRPATVIEFGTSFGISTLHLAAAVRDNGAGRVITTELSRDKIAAARRTFVETGLDDVITVLEGDARETLSGIDGSADFVLLDGWKDLCLPVLRLLEPQMKPGTLVVADDVDLSSLQPYLDYVRSPENGYQSVTFPVEEGMEISCRL